MDKTDWTILIVFGFVVMITAINIDLLITGAW